MSGLALLRQRVRLLVAERVGGGVELRHRSRGGGRAPKFAAGSGGAVVPDVVHFAQQLRHVEHACRHARSLSAPGLRPGQLYGLSLVKNPPTRAALNKVSAATGNVTVLPGPPAEVLFGTSDLVAAVPKHGLFYFLGDSSGGATLVALNLTTGAAVCNKVIGLSEVGYVGIGQTLDYDATKDRLLLSGIDATNKTQHVVYDAPADGCGPFTKVGAYGAAGYLPMLHASALDRRRPASSSPCRLQRRAAAIGIIDLTGAAEMAVVAEGTPDPDDVLIGLHFDAKAKKPIGIVAAQALEFHSLDVDAGVGDASRSPACRRRGMRSAAIPPRSPPSRRRRARSTFWRARATADGQPPARCGARRRRHRRRCRAPAAAAHRTVRGRAFVGLLDGADRGGRGVDSRGLYFHNKSSSHVTRAHTRFL